MNKKLLIDAILPPVSEEQMREAMGKLIIKIDIETREIAKEDPLQKMAKKVWMQLQSDVFDANLQAEFCDFYLEHPDCNIIEIDRLFREEWDI